MSVAEWAAVLACGAFVAWCVLDSWRDVRWWREHDKREQP